MGQSTFNKTYESQIIDISRVLQVFREDENTDALIETTIQHIREAFSYRLIWVGIYDRLEHRMIGKGGITPDGDTTFLKQRFLLNPGDLLEQLVIQQKPIGIPDLRQEARAGEWQEIAQKYELQGTLLFPIRCKDRCFGVALLGSHLWGVSPREAEKAHLAMIFGGLASALYKIEIEWQRAVAKRPDQALLQLLEQIHQKRSLDSRLESVIAQTQQFVQATATNIYWYSPEKRFFWHRLGSQQVNRNSAEYRSNPPGVQVSEVPDFYQALAGGQLVTIGSGRSRLKAKTIEQLLTRLKIRSLLAAPILSNQNLVGFLTVEDKEARIWEEADRKYVLAAGQMITLGIGNEAIEEQLKKTQEKEQFAQEISEILRNSSDLTEAFQKASELLTQKLELDGCFILKENRSKESESSLDQSLLISAKISVPSVSSLEYYDLIYQFNPKKPQSWTDPLVTLTEQDWQRVVQPSGLITVESLEEDQQLAMWHTSLNQIGVRSLIAYQLKQDHTRGILLLTQNKPRSWQESELELIKQFGEQINWVFKLEQFDTHSQKFSNNYEILQTAIKQFSDLALDLGQIEQFWLEYLTQLIEAPIGILLRWESFALNNAPPQERKVKVMGLFTEKNNFSLTPEFSLSVSTDPLIKATFASHGFYKISVSELNPKSRTWLLGEDPLTKGNTIAQTCNINQIIAFPLESYSSARARGIFIFATTPDRNWHSDRFELIPLLINQLSWLYEFRKREKMGESILQDYQLLNWYKHLCLEVLHQSVTSSIGALLSLEAQSNQTGQPKTEAQSLRQIRQQQLLRKLENSVTLLLPTIAEEANRLTSRFTAIPLINVLNQVLPFVQSVSKQRKLLIRIQNQCAFQVYSDPLKLQCVILEIMTTSCQRASEGTNIEISFKALNEQVIIAKEERPRKLMELVFWESHITRSSPKSGEMVHKDYEKMVAASIKPSSLNLKGCQRLMRVLEGALRFYRLEDGSFLTKIQLPLA
jgi:GAF domain-containing protein